MRQKLFENRLTLTPYKETETATHSVKLKEIETSFIVEEFFITGA